MSPKVGDFETIPLGGGGRLHVLPTRRFKSLYARLYVPSPLSADPGDPSMAAAALLPGVLGRATAARPSELAIARHLDGLYGTSLHADVEKRGEEQVLVLSLIGPADRWLPGDASVLAGAVDFLGEVFLRPDLEGGRFRRELVDRERQRLLQVVRGRRNDKMHYAAFRATSFMCRGEAFGVDEYGSEEALEACGPDEVGAAWDRLREREAREVFVAGDVDPGRCEDLVRRALGRGEGGDFPAGPRRAATRAGPAPARPRELVETADAAQGQLVIGFRAPAARDQRGATALALLDGVLGGGPTSRLFRNVREKAGLAYVVLSNVSVFKGVLMIRCGIAPEAYEQARDLALAQVADLRAGNLRESELEEAKSSILLELDALRDAPGATISQAFGRILHGLSEPIDEQAASVRAVGNDEVVGAARGLVLDTVYFLGRPDAGPAKGERVLDLDWDRGSGGGR